MLISLICLVMFSLKIYLIILSGYNLIQYFAFTKSIFNTWNEIKKDYHLKTAMIYSIYLVYILVLESL